MCGSIFKLFYFCLFSLFHFNPSYSSQYIAPFYAYIQPVKRFIFQYGPCVGVCLRKGKSKIPCRVSGYGGFHIEQNGKIGSYRSKVPGLEPWLEHWSSKLIVIFSAKRWAINLRREDLINREPEYLHKNCTVCTEHFEDIMFVNDLRNRLKPTAIPTIVRVNNPPPLVASSRPKPTRKYTDTVDGRQKNAKIRRLGNLFWI